MMSGTATEEQSSSASGTESAAGVTLPEHLQGEVDEATYAKLPPEARSALAETVKSLKGNYTKKHQEVAELRRLKDQLESDPDKATFLKHAMAEYDAQKAGLTVEKRESSKAASRLDALLEETPPEQRKAVKEFVESLDERYQGKLTKQDQELKEIKALVGGLQSSSTHTRQEALESSIKALPGEVGKLARKHREEMVRFGTQPAMAKLSAHKLLQIVSDPDEYRAALLATPQTQDEVTTATRTATSKPTGAIASLDAIVSKEDVIKSRNPKFGDQVNVGSVVSKVLKDLKRGLAG